MKLFSQQSFFWGSNQVSNQCIYIFVSGKKTFPAVYSGGRNREFKLSNRKLWMFFEHRYSYSAHFNRAHFFKTMMSGIFVCRGFLGLRLSWKCVKWNHISVRFRFLQFFFFFYENCWIKARGARIKEVAMIRLLKRNAITLHSLCLVRLNTRCCRLLHFFFAATCHRILLRKCELSVLLCKRNTTSTDGVGFVTFSEIKHSHK